MNEKQLDVKAVELAIAKVMNDSIIGIFGDKDEAGMINKMHAMIDLADTLHIPNLIVQVSLASLRRAKIEFEKEVPEKHEE